MNEKDKLNFCRVEGCFAEKQVGLDVCATHYQEGAKDFIDNCIVGMPSKVLSLNKEKELN